MCSYIPYRCPYIPFMVYTDHWERYGSDVDRRCRRYVAPVDRRPSTVVRCDDGSGLHDNSGDDGGGDDSSDGEGMANGNAMKGPHCE